MRILFAYNGPLKVNEKCIYFSNELNNTIINRYKYFGSHVTFLLRTRLVNEWTASNLMEIDSRDFSVIPVPEFNSILKIVRNYFCICRIIEDAVRNHDIIIARLPSFVGRIAIDYSKKHHKPYLVEAVGCPWDALSHHSLLGKILAPFAYLQMRRYISNAPYVMYVTQNFLQERYPNPNSNTGVSDVVLEEPDVHVLNQRLERIARIDQQKCYLTLLTVAGLDARFKGQDLVLKAMSLLKRKGIFLRYIMIGRGAGDRLRRLAAELEISSQVEILGEVTHKDVFQHLDNCDLYIQPSRQEGLPRALVEAMSRGCPAFGARTGGIPEILDSGSIFSPRDVNELACLLENINAADLEREAKRNFSFSKHFYPSELRKKREAFYDTFLKGNFYSNNTREIESQPF